MVMIWIMKLNINYIFYKNIHFAFFILFEYNKPQLNRTIIKSILLLYLLF